VPTTGCCCCLMLLLLLLWAERVFVGTVGVWAGHHSRNQLYHIHEQSPSATGCCTTLRPVCIMC